MYSLSTCMKLLVVWRTNVAESDEKSVGIELRRVVGDGKTVARAGNGH